MTGRVIAAGLLALAGGCAPAPVNPDAPASSGENSPAPAASHALATPTPTPSATGAQVASLAGEWRVAGIDGADFNESYGIALSADEDAIWWAPRCSGQERLYTIDGVGFEAIRPEPVGDAVCDIAWPERLPDVWRAIDAATRIERTPSNGVLLSGGGHSVLLFSQ